MCFCSVAILAQAISTGAIVPYCALDFLFDVLACNSADAWDWHRTAQAELLEEVATPNCSQYLTSDVRRFPPVPPQINVVAIRAPTGKRKNKNKQQQPTLI